MGAGISLLDTYRYETRICLRPYRYLTAARRCLAALCLTALCITETMAQEWNTHWIHHPEASAGEQVWFHRTLTVDGPATKARLVTASEGRFVVYVNGYNVTPDVFSPYGAWQTDTIRPVKCDITGYLQPGENTMAVWTAPRGNTHRQLSLMLNGRTADGREIVLTTDERWLCRTTGCRTNTDGNETVDGNASIDGRNEQYGREISVMRWIPAIESGTQGEREPMPMELPRSTAQVKQIRECAAIEVLGDSIVCRFGHPFNGQVRVTLRDMERGDTLRIGGLTYICTGESDEQACRRFTTDTQDKAVISGNGRLRRENIMKIEAVCIGESPLRGLPYLP